MPFLLKKNIQKGKELDLRAELNSQDKTLLWNSPHPRRTDVFYPRLAFAKEPLVRISKKTFSLFKSVTDDHLGFLSVSV